MSVLHQPLASVGSGASSKRHFAMAVPASPAGLEASAMRSSVPIPGSSRVSMEEYYDHHQRERDTVPADPPACSLDDLDSPPSYDALVQPVHLRRKFNIQPREDEGKETLPPYSTAISLEGVFLKKMELDGPVERAQDRNWYRVLVTLQGTALTLHKYKASNVFSKYDVGRKRNPDFPTGTKDEQLLRSYNLQHAEAGLATDYIKKRYVIRVRAETEQFLLSCVKIETLVLWLQALFAAIDLATPLDDREIPKDQSVPRPWQRPTRRRHPSNNVENNASPRDPQESMTTQNRRAAETIPEEDATFTAPPSPTILATTQTAPAEIPTSTDTLITASEAALMAARPRTRSDALPPSIMQRERVIVSSKPNPSISPETGKWRPDHHWTAMYDLMYAKRCLGVLMETSPRKTNLVIMKGKRWMVDWATGALTRCEPPDYGEVAAATPARGTGTGTGYARPVITGQ